MKFAAFIALLAIVSGEDTTPADDIRTKFYKLEVELWRNVTNAQWIDSTLGADVELTKAFAAFDNSLQSINAIPRPPINSWLWSRLVEHLGLIEGQYKHFVQFVHRESVPGVVSAPVREWLELTEAILHDPKSSVAQSVEKLNKLLNEDGYIVMCQSLLLEESSDVCNLQMSPHQLIYDIYNTIALTEIKGYAMMQFSWMLLKIYGKGNYTQEANLTRQRYGQRAVQSAQVVRGALAVASRDVYKCDPPQHIEGSTFDQVTRLLQGYIENEVDMNPEGTCKENCAFYTLTNNFGCFKEQFCTKQPTCRGRIIDCQYMDSDMWVCPAASYPSKRRYEWIEYENGKTLGKPGSCTRGTTKVDSWWKWNLLHCSYCLCLCEDNVNYSERFFSTKESLADITKNKVVTGIRLVKYGRIFHLQIHEGTLKERGHIEAGSWVPVQKFDPLDDGYTEGKDYHTLTYERRAIDLDELDSPEGSALTGVRFSVIGAHLHFEIRATPFNYTTGRLSPAKSQWISNDNTEGSLRPRSKLELYKPDIPTASHTPLPLDSEHDQYIEFTHSDFDADAAQSTVPFIDVQPVLPAKGSSLISGAGIIHRGARGSGGYIAVKLITYPYSRHVKAEPPPSDIIEDEMTNDFNPPVN